MENQQFVLRWHYQQSTLAYNLPNLLESNILTDVTLSADNQIIKAHKLILATCSNYFLQLFKEMGPMVHPVVVLHDVPFDDLKAIVAFIYKGQCLVTKNQIPSLLSAAKLLKIQGLCDIKMDDYLMPKEKTPPFHHHPINLRKKNMKNEDNLLTQSKSETCETAEKDNPSSENNNGDKRTVVESHDDALNNNNLYKKLCGKESTETCKCFICGKYLSNQYNLRVHMETHEETYHACQSCPHISRSRDALRKHVSYRHPEEYSVRKRKRNDH